MIFCRNNDEENADSRDNELLVLGNKILSFLGGSMLFETKKWEGYFGASRVLLGVYTPGIVPMLYFPGCELIFLSLLTFNPLFCSCFISVAILLVLFISNFILLFLNVKFGILFGGIFSFLVIYPAVMVLNSLTAMFHCC